MKNTFSNQFATVNRTLVCFYFVICGFLASTASADFTNPGDDPNFSQTPPAVSSTTVPAEAADGEIFLQWTFTLNPQTHAPAAIFQIQERSRPITGSFGSWNSLGSFSSESRNEILTNKYGPAYFAFRIRACNNLCSDWVETAEVLTGVPPVTVAQAIEGFAEVHSHPAAEQSFGGSWYHGDLNGPESVALERCDGGLYGKDGHRAHGWVDVGVHTNIVLGALGGIPDVGRHHSPLGVGRNGHDNRECQYVRFLGKDWWAVPGTCPTENYSGWPHWKGRAHQAMWHGWINKARSEGMRLLVASVYESNFQCKNTTLSTRKYPNCNEQEASFRQLNFLKDFASNNSWVEIATSSNHARQIIADGKLAMVLAVEITNLMPAGDYSEILEDYYDLGVRSIQLTHHADNRFTGTAPLGQIIQSADAIELLPSNPSDYTFINDTVCKNAAGMTGKCDGEDYLNIQGLTTEGEDLVGMMMDRGMIIDVAHISRLALEDVYEMALSRNAYPLFYSHTHLWSTIEPDNHSTHSEKYLKDSEFHMIKNTGGLIGLRTGNERTINYKAPLVTEECQGSVNSFMQSLMYAVDNGLTVAFGADFNGFIDQMKPCPTSVSTPLREKGMPDIGLLPEVIKEMKYQGVDKKYTDHLENSAEAFLRMWHRSEQRKVESAQGIPTGQ